MIRQYISTGSLDRLVLPIQKSSLESQAQGLTVFESPASSNQASIGSYRALFLFPFFLCYARIRRLILYQQAKGFRVFIDQATPGFELGKKDLQSPALPLGHAAKTIKIDGNIP